VFNRTDDFRFLNVTLKLIDKIYINCGWVEGLTCIIGKRGKALFNLKIKVEKALDHWSLEKREPSKVDIFTPLSKIPTIDEIVENSRSTLSVSKAADIVIFSPNYRSLYTITAIKILQSRGHRIKGVVIRKMLSSARVKSELRRDGVGWILKKIMYKLIFRGQRRQFGNQNSLARIASKLGLRGVSAIGLCERYNIPFLVTPDFNSIETVGFLTQVKPAVALFTGGGLLKENVINAITGGVINVHGGLLPGYRGLDVEKWAVFEGNPNSIGVSAHLMVSAVDLGPVLFQWRVAGITSFSFDVLRRAFEVPQLILAILAVDAIAAGNFGFITQRPEQGRQFYYMHRRLSKLLSKKMTDAALY
jgi:hypothetical protein